MIITFNLLTTRFKVSKFIIMALEPTQLPIQRVKGAPSLGLKRPGREAVQSPPSSPEVNEYVELQLHSPKTL